MRFVLYLLRWQLSTPILWACLAVLLPAMDELWATVVANLVGGAVFYSVDERIFKCVKNKRK